jgi:cobalt-zinc-cadmium efflux system protein
MHEHNHSQAADERRLLVVLGMTVTYMLAAVIGGLLTGSLALLADSGHLLSDVLGLAMAFAAIRFARRPATAGKTYGFYRTEILAALANSLLLLLVGLSILYQAWQRLAEPLDVHAAPMLLVACAGVIVTLTGVWLLHGGQQQSLNIRGAFLEVLGDLFGSLGTLLAALLILATGWTVADSLVSAAIGVLMLPRAWGLLGSVVDVLLEATPRHMDVHEIESAMRAVPGVDSVHDLHIWSITSGFVAMSGHVRSNGRASEEVLHDLQAMLRSRCGIEHLTLQVEALDHADDGACCTLDPRCFVPARVAATAGPSLARPEHSRTAQ